MQKLGGFPVNSKLTVSTINVFFAGLPRWIPLRLAFFVVHVYTYVARVPVVVGSIPHQIAYFVFLYFFVIFFQIYQKKTVSCSKCQLTCTRVLVSLVRILT